MASQPGQGTDTAGKILAPGPTLGQKAAAPGSVLARWKVPTEGGSVGRKLVPACANWSGIPIPGGV